jgi:MFS family permease
MTFVFVAYLVVGLAMPVVPLYVRNELGLSNFMVGLVAGSPFAAALLSRLVAGRFADTRGAKHAVVIGMLTAATGGGLFLLSRAVVEQASLAVSILLIGRALLGVADSFIITGALSWGLALMGAQSAGKVMAWVGTSLYAAFAIGAPLGTALYGSYGFFAIALATLVIPLGSLALLVPLPVASAPAQTQRTGITSLVGAVWAPGIALALSGVGFGAIMAFIALLFVDHRWAPVWPAFSGLSAAFIVGRLVFGGLADRIGGAKVSFVCILIEAAGLFLIWAAPSMPIALAGIALSGFGYSLVYPSLGVEAIRRARAENRGVTMGAYTAFLDLSLGVSSPLLGLLAGDTGLKSIYLVSAVSVLVAAGLTLRLRQLRS